MFVQIHMLQSMPPGNLNRDETGQPKKCIFGGVTRGRISSQCLKRNIRHSMQFKEAFGDGRSVRTRYLPRMVADELKMLKPDFSDDEVAKIKAALAGKFRAERSKGESGAEEESEDGQEQSESSSDQSGNTDQTGQLVFFPPPFAKSIAELLVKFKTEHPDAFDFFIGESKKKLTKKEKNGLEKTINECFLKPAEAASKSLTVDIGMFGRMTTSDLVVNVEAACQVAHAISTHEAIIESDYFTAMDEKKSEFALTQTDETGAGFLGKGETGTFFSSAVFYKYLNLDLDALKKHLNMEEEKVAHAAGVFVSAAALANPTGKQNSFAAHGVPELILVEMSKTKRPISYANAFLHAVEGSNLMAESAKALQHYLSTVATAFAPADMRRLLLAVGPASVEINGAYCVATIDELSDAVRLLVKEGAA